MKQNDQASPRAEFRFLSPSRDFTATGIKRELPRGPVTTLAERVNRFLNAFEDGPSRLVGAIPFNRDGLDYIYQPEEFSSNARAQQRSASVAGVASDESWLVKAVPPARHYGAAVARCLEIIAASRNDAEPLRKVVLSRSLAVNARNAIDPYPLLDQLSQDPSITAFLTPLPGAGSPLLIGATPELLVSRQGRTVVSHPLAGSARRDLDPALDRQSAQWLEQSDKNQREHREVVMAVMDALSPYCSQLSAPDGTTLRATATMWHLGTRIVGTLKDETVSVAELAALLHPTPAVCGMPRQRAAEVIRNLEEYDRNFYAGAVGWVDGNGDGEWYVALRCAEVNGSDVRLFAGAGIVAGSEPAAEIDETSAKFIAMLSALGIDENGHPLSEKAA